MHAVRIIGTAAKTSVLGNGVVFRAVTGGQLMFCIWHD
jgi:hypothetical protein